MIQSTYMYISTEGKVMTLTFDRDLSLAGATPPSMEQLVSLRRS